MYAVAFYFGEQRQLKNYQTNERTKLALYKMYTVVRVTMYLYKMAFFSSFFTLDSLKIEYCIALIAAYTRIHHSRNPLIISR